MYKALERYKYWYLTLVILLAILAGANLPYIKINTDFSQLLPEDDPEYAFYNQLKHQ